MSEKSFDSEGNSGITGIESFSYHMGDTEIKEVRSKYFEELKELYDSGVTESENIEDVKSITGPVDGIGPGSYTGYIGIPSEPKRNKGIGYTGLQEILKKAASGTLTDEDFLFYSGSMTNEETEEEKRTREEIENLSKIWMLRPIEYGDDNIYVEKIENKLPELQQPIKQQKNVNNYIFNFRKFKRAVADALITLGYYLKNEVKNEAEHQQTKVLIPCKKCKGLGFKKKLFSKKYDKGTEEYKSTFRICKHCNGNGIVLKDISKKSARYVNKAILYEKKYTSDGIL